MQLIVTETVCSIYKRTEEALTGPCLLFVGRKNGVLYDIKGSVGSTATAASAQP